MTYGQFALVKFHNNTKARTLASSIIKTFRYRRIIASSVKLKWRQLRGSP